MKIGIDARLVNETGVGRYIRNLLRVLAEIDKTNEYIIFLPPNAYDTFALPNNRWKKRLVRIHWHTVAEQIILPFIFLREKLDLLHVPYFTVPLFYVGKVVATIHDITILHKKTGKSTTLPYPFYLLKWYAYRIILNLGIKRSVAILTVSESVKHELIHTLQVLERKITVTYEGVDPAFFTKKTEERMYPYSYFLYVGNVYPHKQAEFLLRSYKKFIDASTETGTKEIPKLLFVGKKDFFYERLETVVQELDISDHVVFLHNISDGILRGLYQHAVSLVFPSESEGFGLPALEALSQGCPLIVSDIPVFHELLNGFADYADHSEVQWSKMMREHWNRKNNPSDRDKIREFLARYSWEELAKKTKQVYEYCIGIRSN